MDDVAPGRFRVSCYQPHVVVPVNLQSSELHVQYWRNAVGGDTQASDNETHQRDDPVPANAAANSKS